MLHLNNLEKKPNQDETRGTLYLWMKEAFIRITNPKIYDGKNERDEIAEKENQRHYKQVLMDLELFEIIKMIFLILGFEYERVIRSFQAKFQWKYLIREQCTCIY